MIKPDKFTDYDSSLLYISSRIMVILKNMQRIKIKKMEKMLQSQGVYIETDEYKYSLDLLFCLAIIDYDIETDEIYTLV